MNGKGISKRTVVLIALLALCAGALGTSKVQVLALEKELKAIAKEKTDDHADDQREPTTRFETAARVYASRDYVLFGAVRGKVSVFVRETSKSGKQSVGQIDYFYTKSAEGWDLEESGACVDAECHTNVEKAFAQT